MFQPHTNGGLHGQIDRVPQEFLDSIFYAISAHHSHLVRKGRPYVSRVSEFRVDPELGDLVCDVQGSVSWPYLVTIEIDLEDPEVYGAYCTCDYSDELNFCKHTYAALTKLKGELENPKSPLTYRLFNIGGQAEGEPWKIALAELDDFVQRQSARSSAQPVVPSRRLTWRVEYDPNRGPTSLNVVPYEQKRSKSGDGWTKGRKVSWSRMVSEVEGFATASELKIVELTKRDSGGYYGRYERYYGYVDEPDTMAVLDLLVGHPLVVWFDRPDETIEVAKGTLGLAAVATKKGIEIQPAIDGRSPLDPLYCLVGQEYAVDIDRTGNRIVVASASEELVGLVTRIAQLHATVPQTQEQELLARLVQLEPLVPITLPDEHLGGTAEPDVRTYLRLTPIAPEGLVAELKVRPAPDGVAFEPGQGLPRVR